MLSKVDVAAVKDGQLVRERLEDGAVTQVEALGDAPTPLRVGAGASKKIKHLQGQSLQKRLGQ